MILLDYSPFNPRGMEGGEMTLTVIDGGDRSASHVLVLDAGVPAATAKLRIMSEGQGKIARIAVLPAHRGMASVDTGHSLIRMRKEV